MKSAKNVLTNPKLQIVGVVGVVVLVIVLALVLSKKIIVDGHECYIMPVVGTIRCGKAHKYIGGLLIALLVAGTVAYFVLQNKLGSLTSSE